MNILEAVKENETKRVRPAGFAIKTKTQEEKYEWWPVGELVRCTKKKTVAFGAHLIVAEWEAEKPKLKLVENG